MVLGPVAFPGTPQKEESPPSMEIDVGSRGAHQCCRCSRRLLADARGIGRLCLPAVAALKVLLLALRQFQYSCEQLGQ